VRGEGRPTVALIAGLDAEMDTWEAVLPRRAYFVHDDRPEIVIETLRELVESTRARASEQRDKAGATAGPNG
jgi:hypothetical protein